MKKGPTEIVFILDQSKAMESWQENLILGFNDIIKSQQSVEGEAVVTTVLFNDSVSVLHDRINCEAVAPINKERFNASGNLALMDAIGSAIHMVRKVQKNTKEEFYAENVIFIIIAAGLENASRHYTDEMVRKRIEHQKSKYGWKFIFAGLSIFAHDARKIGLDSDFINDFYTDTSGVRVLCSKISSIITDIRTGKPEQANPGSGYVHEIQNIIRKHWSRDAVIITEVMHPKADTLLYDDDNPCQKNCVAEEDLLPGELCAYTFSIGCYTVRHARRVYKVHSPGYSPDMEIPADKSETERVRESVGIIINDWKKELRVTHEISVRHNDNPNSTFIYICRAARSTGPSWYESIDAVCAAKAKDSIPDEYASLLVCMHFEGSSYGVDTWYKFDPTGKITRLTLNPLNEKPDETRFI